jgi:hypothetical protein
MRLAFGVEYMATTRFLFGTVFPLLSVCLSDKKNGRTCPNAGHAGVWGSRCVAPDVHNFGTRWNGSSYQVSGDR